MDIRYKLFPYPVLTYYLDDYPNDEYDVKVEIAREGYSVNIQFTATLTNAEIKSLIAEQKAKYVYHFECAQTGYRKVLVTDNAIDHFSISCKEVCGKLQICPFIVATENISEYTNSGFHEDYQGMCFGIEQGCVLAVGKQVNIEIEKDMNDWANAPSVFSIIRNADPSVHQMLVDIQKNKITVKMPLNEFYSYKQLGKAYELQPVLNAIVIIPALTYVLEELKAISNEEDFAGLEDYLWYRTLRKALHEKFDCDIESNDFRQKNMLELAQKLVGDPLSEAFKVLTSDYGSDGENEE